LTGGDVYDGGFMLCAPGGLDMHLVNVALATAGLVGVVDGLRDAPHQIPH
jgi:hypothetical protein